MFEMKYYEWKKSRKNFEQQLRERLSPGVARRINNNRPIKRRSNLFKRRTGDRKGLFGATVDQGELSFSKKLKSGESGICASEDKTKENDTSFKTKNVDISVKEAKKIDRSGAECKQFATTDVNQVKISPLKSQSNKIKSESPEQNDMKIALQAIVAPGEEKAPSMCKKSNGVINVEFR